MSLKQLQQAAARISQYLDWDMETINETHAYCQRFHPGRAGSNVYALILEDALRSRGITIEQFRSERSEPDKA
jgi:hypothetical protein